MKNFKIQTKLIALSVFMLLGMVAIGVTSLSSLKQINDSSAEISKVWMPSIVAIEQVNTLTSDYRCLEFEHVVTQDSAELARIEQEMADINNKIETQLASYIPADSTDQGYLDKVKQDWTKYMSSNQNMLQLSRELNSDAALNMLLGDSHLLFDETNDYLMQIVQYNVDSGNDASAETDRIYGSVSTVSIVMIVVIAVLFSGLAVLIILRIVRPVREMDSVARKIAEGDLNSEITYDSRDELGVLAGNFNKTVNRLRDYVNYIDEIAKVLGGIAQGNLAFQLTYDYAGEFAKVKTALDNVSRSLNSTMGQINQSAEQVALGSDQVSSGAQALSQGATEQASSIEELAATISAISQQVNQSAENAQSARLQSESAGKEVATSNHRMQDMVAAMGDINSKSTEIGKIIKTIEDIAFQTNILALNAAVEAARAGAAGKGFAVVADEVRNLAGKSADAAKNTTALIEATVEAVEHGTQIADDTAKSMQSVVEGTQGVTRLILDIASAASEQAEAIMQVTTGLDQISSVVQTNSATAEESAAASEELSGQAQILQGMVGKFTLRDSSETADERRTEHRMPAQPAPSSSFSLSTDFSSPSQKY